MDYRSPESPPAELGYRVVWGLSSSLPYKRLESGLFEVMVRSKRFGNTFTVHHNKGNAIGKGPSLVSATSIQFNPKKKYFWLGRDYNDVRICLNVIKQ